ncbi:MAG: sensor histidine kinase [Actinomycetota bacterium]
MPLSLLRRSLLIDAALAAALFATALLPLTGLGEVSGDRPLDALGVAFIAGQTVTLAWRRKYPVAVLVVVASSFAIDRWFDYPSGTALFGVAIALYTVGAELSARRSAIVGGITIGLIVSWTSVGVISLGLPASVVLTMFVLVALPFVLGREVRKHEQRVLEYEARAIRAEFDREMQATEAVRQEQARIARELHDVVAHEVIVMTIQAAAANRVLDTSPKDAREAIDTVQEYGRRALTEMRRLLGLLRSGAESDLGPQPGLDDLATLVRQLSDAGLEVDLTIEGEYRTLPVGIDVNAYRIIQEALTNTVKHGGPGAKADVIVRYGGNALTVAIDDDGRGAAEGLSHHGSGQGIAGMKERVALLDGTLEAGPRPGGGYRVRGVIPLEIT